MDREDIIYRLKMLLIAEVAAILGATLLMILVGIIVGEWTLLFYPVLIVGALFLWGGCVFVDWLIDELLD